MIIRLIIGKSNIRETNSGKLKLFLTGLFIAVILASSMLAVSGQVLTASAPGPEGAYCVNTGYLYATVPGVNNGKPICQFPDNSWCDAHAYYAGNCTPSFSGYISPSGYVATGGIVTPSGVVVPSSVYPSGVYNPYATNPYYYNNPAYANVTQSALDIADETKTCQKIGGNVQQVHTTYGDVNLCVFPDGSSLDLPQLASGAYSGVYPGVYSGVPGPVVYDNGIPFNDSWFYYAYSWLNAP